MSAIASYARPDEIRSLTGLRGVAALYVVMFHARCLGDYPALIAPVFAHGYIAVDLFFVLSGFVLALTAAQPFTRSASWNDIRHFLGLRLARIYPLFVLMTLLTVFASRGDGAVRLHDLLFNLLLIHSWGFAGAIITPGWSISTEWAAYLLFPWLSRFAGKACWPLAMIFAAAAFSTLILIAYGPEKLAGVPIAARMGPLDISSSFAAGTLIRCLAEFCLGLLAFRWRHYVTSRFGLPLSLATILLLVWRNSDLLLVPAFVLLIMALSHDAGGLARRLGGRALHMLGCMSYALYLCQDIIIRIFEGGLHGWSAAIPAPLRILLATGLSLAFSGLLHYGFEIRARQGLRRWLTRPPLIAQARETA